MNPTPATGRRPLRLDRVGAFLAIALTVYLWLLALPAEIALVGIAGWKAREIVRAYRKRFRAMRSFPEDFPRAEWKGCWARTFRPGP